MSKQESKPLSEVLGLEGVEVPSDERDGALADMFGVWNAETILFDMAQQIFPDYPGGWWRFFRLPTGTCIFLPPVEDDTSRIEVEVPFGNEFYGKVDWATAGLIVTLFVLVRVMEQYGAGMDEGLRDRLSQHYETLFDTANALPDGGVGFRQAVD